MKRVLVTGGTGFVGRNVIGPLLTRGYEVHLVTRQMPEPSVEGVVIHQLDLLDCGGHQRLIQSICPSHFVHAGWFAEHGRFWDAVENVFWLKATLSLVEEFCKAGGERMVGVGTCAEYDWSYGLFVEGETPENPGNLYGSSKRAAYQSSSRLADSYSTSFAWARIFFPYGPGEPENRLIPNVITNLLRGMPARCTHGNQFRDFLHVADIGDALAALLDSGACGAVNIASGIPTRIGELANRIGSALGRPELVLLGAIPEPSNSARMIVADTSRLLKEVGWTPGMSLDEGLSKTIDWWRAKIAKTT